VTKIRNPKRAKREARQGRVRRGLVTSERPRLTVFRSAKHIYAQIEDGVTGRTLGAASTRSPAVRGELQTTGNVAAAKRVGQAIAEVARAKGIDKVVFNRNGFLYHGRVKALAEAAREAGLEF
jgi:large subunit ribosomal protein L18